MFAGFRPYFSDVGTVEVQSKLPTETRSPTLSLPLVKVYELGNFGLRANKPSSAFQVVSLL